MKVQNGRTHGSWLVVTVVFAKFLIFSRTTEMPRSSDAFSSSTRERYNSGPNSCLHRARIVEVLPVPGGP